MCKWESQYVRDYRCDDSPLDGDPKGYCILHAEDDNKDLEAFRQKVEGRIKTTGDRIDLIGCYFPSSFEAGPFVEKGRFEKPVDFSGATFSEVADFSEVKFIKDAIFGGANFRKEVHFFKTEFHGEADFLEATFSQGAEFGPGVLFKGYAKFEEVTFGGIADFWGTFKQDVKFFKVRFQEANFSGTDFCGMVEFSESHFEGDAYFTGVIFEETSEKAEFKDIVFQKEVNFSSTYCLKTEIDFTGTIFKGRTLFMPRLPSGPTQDIEFGSVVFNTVSFLG